MLFHFNAVIGLALSLIAHVVVVVFVVAILNKIFLYGRYTLYNKNVAILELGSPCSPRSALFARDLIRHSLQRVAPFNHDLFRLRR